MIKLLLYSFIFLSLLACTPVQDLQSFILNSSGNNYLLAQNYSLAQQKYIEALKNRPLRSELHLNLGFTFEMLQKNQEALSSYSEAIKNQSSPESTFMALFNKAQLLAKAGDIDNALKNYQLALVLNPESKEVKTNIELLIQQQQQQQQQQQSDQQKEDKGGQGGDSKDKKDQDKKDENKEKNKDKQDQDQNKDNKDQKEKNKEYKKSPKYQPRPFKGDKLDQSDVNKILNELKHQEQRIRAQYHNKEIKESSREKDW